METREEGARPALFVFLPLTHVVQLPKFRPLTEKITKYRYPLLSDSFLGYRSDEFSLLSSSESLLRCFFLKQKKIYGLPVRGVANNR